MNINKIFKDEWINIMEEIARFRRNSHSNWIWFRGQSSTNYTLDSGLFRIKENGKYRSIDYYLNNEYLLYLSFINQAASIIPNGLNSWEIAFQMQHYGTKTRLLDWTESLSSALYFAFNSWKYKKGESAVLWLLDPYALNEVLINDDHILTIDSSGLKNFVEQYKKNSDKSYDSFAIYPTKVNSRLLSQAGFFTVQGNKLMSLDEEIKHKLGENQRVIKRIILPPALVDNVYEYLVLNGVNDFTMFNDLEGLSKSLNKDIIDRLFDERLENIVRFRKNPNHENNL